MLKKLLPSLGLLAALIVPLGAIFAQVPPPVPALPDAERRVQYSISGTTCNCSVGFALFGDGVDYGNWIEVWVNGALQSSSTYTITSATGPLAIIPRPITDALLTFNAATTGTVQIVGARRPRRTSQFAENQGVSARNLNQVITDIVAVERELWDKTNDVTGRAVLAPPGETLLTLPPRASRLSQGACFDSNGNLVTCVSVPGSTFSAGSGITFTGVGPTAISANPPANNSITNGMLAQGPATTVKCNNTSGTANETDCTLQAPGLAFSGTSIVAAASRIYNITLPPYSAPCNYNAVSDAAMGSGSTTLTSATANFTAGDVGKYIAVQGAGAAGVNLFTTIATFVNSTTVTLTSGNASGAGIANKLIEYGSDDTPAIQSAFNAAAVVGGTLYTPGGRRCLVSRLNATNTSVSVDIRGDGVNGSAWFPEQVASYGTTTGHMIDTAGSAFIQFHNIQIGAFYELAAPTTAIFMAQVASGASNRMLLGDGVYISGQFTVSTIYNYGVPSSECRHGDFYNYRAGAGGQDVMRFSATNAASLASSFATVTSGSQSTSDWTFTDCEFHKFSGAGATTDVIQLDAVSNLNFIGGVISGGASEYVQFANAWSKIVFLGVTFETESQPVIPNNAFFLAAGSVGVGISRKQSSFVLGSTLYGGTGTVVESDAQTQAMAVASLPSCTAALEGTTYGVTDANASTFHTTVANGGANHVAVYCNGTNWVIGG